MKRIIIISSIFGLCIGVFIRLAGAEPAQDFARQIWLEAQLPDSVDTFVIYRKVEMGDVSSIYLAGLINNKPYCFVWTHDDTVALPVTPTPAKEYLIGISKPLTANHRYHCKAGIKTAVGDWRVAKFLTYETRPVYFVPATRTRQSDASIQTEIQWSQRKKVGSVQALSTKCDPPWIKETFFSYWMRIDNAAITQTMRDKISKLPSAYGAIVASCERYVP